MHASELAGEFPQLDILELVGEGGMGAVYRARQRNLERMVAVKVLPRAVGKEPGFSERFAREARALARLNHPNIVAVYDFGRTAGESGLYYFIMEYVDGASLRELVQGGEMEPKQALAIVPQICEALQFAHDEGIVHRDIKPENILVDRKGRVKIADFGLAKILDRPSGTDTLTREGQFMGTPLYMAPEQREKAHAVDHRADIYSLGVVFYEMLTGELPTGRFSPPSQRVKVDIRLDEVVLRTLEREPDLRYQHAREVKTEVETISSSPHTSAPSAEARPASCRAQVVNAARGLIWTGVINWVSLVAALLTIVLVGISGRLGRIPEPVLVIIALVVFFSSAVMFLAGLQLMRLEARGLALFAACLAMIVPPGIIIGLPVGIWVWVVLLRSDVREAFADAPRSEPWPDRIRRFLHSTQNCSALLCTVAVLTIVIPWLRVTWFFYLWCFGFDIWQGIAVTSLAAGLLVVLFVTGNIRPRPLTRSIVVLAGGVAIAVIPSLLVHTVVVESGKAAAAYDPDWYPQTTDKDGKGDRVSEVSEAFNAQLNTIMVKSMKLQPGAFLAIAAGLGLVVTSLIELAGRFRDRGHASPGATPGASGVPAPRPAI